MCAHGDTVTLLLPTPDTSDPQGKHYTLELWEIDRCIAPIVAALNAAGIATRNSCCGHGKTAGGIFLADGTALVITTHAGLRTENRLPSACASIPPGRVDGA